MSINDAILETALPLYRQKLEELGTDEADIEDVLALFEANIHTMSQHTFQQTNYNTSDIETITTTAIKTAIKEADRDLISNPFELASKIHFDLIDVVKKRDESDELADSRKEEVTDPKATIEAYLSNTPDLDIIRNEAEEEEKDKQTISSLAADVVAEQEAAKVRAKIRHFLQENKKLQPPLLPIKAASLAESDLQDRRELPAPLADEGKKVTGITEEQEATAEITEEEEVTGLTEEAAADDKNKTSASSKSDTAEKAKNSKTVMAKVNKTAALTALIVGAGGLATLANSTKREQEVDQQTGQVQETKKPNWFKRILGVAVVAAAIAVGYKASQGKGLKESWVDFTNRGGNNNDKGNSLGK